MRITIPTGARLQNMEGFCKRVTQADDPSLHLTFPSSGYFNVHPMVMTAIVAAGLRARRVGADVTVDGVAKTPSIQYLDRMGLFRLLGIESGLDVTAREEAGRFEPLRVIRTGRELSDFVVQLVPLLHTDQQEASPIQYVMSELVRNVLEHSGKDPAAVVAAQVYRKSNVVAIGVADCGVGIREGLSGSYPRSSDLEALQLALRPGVTGTTTRLGGTEDNAGAGLFFCKAMAFTSHNYMVIHSGSGFFKLKKRKPFEADERILIWTDAARDHATRYDELPGWPGTLVGIDISTTAYREFNSFLAYVREAYDVDVKDRRKARFKTKAKFT